MTFFSSVDTGDLINRQAASRETTPASANIDDADLARTCPSSTVSSPRPLTRVSQVCSPITVPRTSLTQHQGLLSCIGEAVLIVLGAKHLAAMLPLAIVVLYLLQKFYLCTSRQLRVLDLQAKAPLYTQLLETIEGLPTIRAFYWQPAMTESSLALLDQSQRPHYLLYSIQRWLILVLDLLVAASAVLLVLFGVLAHASTPGNMAIAMYSALGFSESLAKFLSSWTSLETSLGAISRLKEFIKVTPQEVEKNPKPPASWPRIGHLQWQNVKASYAKQPGMDAVLYGISLDIQPGQKVAICGRTGSGKSSLVATLFGLIDYVGTITIDGVDISSISNQALRQGLIVIPQNPVLFPGSLRSNLLPYIQHGQMVQDENVIALLQRLQIWDAVRQSGSLDTQVEHLALSHGQMQLLCLARAILRKHESNVLIMDEATSGVDYRTEKVMLEAIGTELPGHTVVSVVHRLGTIGDFDKLVVIDRGRIVQEVTPAELLTVDGRLQAPGAT